MWILSIVIFTVGVSSTQEKYAVYEYKTEQECIVQKDAFKKAADDKDMNYIARCMTKEQYDQIKKK